VLIKFLAKSLVDALPGKEAISKWGALFPLPLRSYLSYRFFSAVARRTLNQMHLKTNMGISQNYVCDLSSQNHHVALFGKPEYYWGERGALMLSEYLTKYSDAFVDIGAHIGYFTFYIREKIEADKPVYFFEPDPDLFDLVYKNVNSNTMKNVHGFRTAIGSTEGTITFYKNMSDPLSGSITRDFSCTHNVEKIQVNSTTFSIFSRQFSLKNACVKVDVEGAEFDFIEGALDSLDSIAYLIMEVLGIANERQIVQYMISLGFFAYYINDYCLEQSMDGSFKYIDPQYNWLFCHDTPCQLRTKLAGSTFTVVSAEAPQNKLN
jgi:FkbM family methyltransferase